MRCDVLYYYGMVLTICHVSKFLYPSGFLTPISARSLVTLNLLHEVSAQLVKKFPPFMEYEGLQEPTTDFFPHFYFICSIFNDSLCNSDYIAVSD
jgi:hypothetical protein